MRELRRVTMRVEQTGLVRRGEKCAARLVGLSALHVVLGDDDGAGAALLQELCDLAMQRRAATPGDRVVDGLARQRVAKCSAAAFDLDDQPEVERLVEAGLAGTSRDILEVEPVAQDGGELERSTRSVRKHSGAQEYGVANAVRNGQLLARVQCRAVIRLAQPSRGVERRKELLDEKRDTLRPVVEDAS